jgi:hypothetical protein
MDKQRFGAPEHPTATPSSRNRSTRPSVRQNQIERQFLTTKYHRTQHDRRPAGMHARRSTNACASDDAGASVKSAMRISFCSFCETEQKT